MHLQKPAIVLSGHTVALAVVRALGERGIPVMVVHYNPRDIAHVSRFVVDHIEVPNPIQREDAFIEALIDARRRLRGGVIFPASDESLVAISRHRSRLDEHFTVACPEWEIVQRYIDKTVTYQLAVTKGVPCPRTLAVLPHESPQLRAQPLGYPLLVKPAQSHLFYERFRRKMVRVETPDELDAVCAATREAALDVMLQEIIPGDDSTVVNYNAYVCDGQALVEFTARQIRKAPPFYGSPRVVRSEWIPDIIEPGREILSSLGFYGYANVEFKFDRRDGQYKLIEVNGRPNLSGLLAVRCGVNFPLIHYEHLVYGTRPEPRVSATSLYWTDIFRDAGYGLMYLGRENQKLRDYLSPYVNPHCDAIVDTGDLKPSWSRLSYLARNLPRAMRGAAIGRSTRAKG